MVQKYRRVWSLVMAMLLLCSCALSPLSIRVSATIQNDHALLTQVGDTSGKPEEQSGEEMIEETEEDPTEETETDPTEETEADPAEELQEDTEETPAPLEPDNTGCPVIPGMREHLASKPGTDYTSFTSGAAYLDLELFEGIEVDHINVYASSIAAGDENQYITVSVVDVATLAKTEYRFYAREEALTGFAAGRIVSLYPEDGITVKVEQSQTLVFGKNGDPLVCDFQNDDNVPDPIKGFYLQDDFNSGTASGCICVDVYAKEEPPASRRDTLLRSMLQGKKLSILGDGLSTFEGYSNSTAVNNTLGSNEVFYSADEAPWSVLQTWWKQAADRYGMALLVNNAWYGSTVTTGSGSGEAGFDRAGNLHDNTGAAVNPDIIAVYMGTNDLIDNAACGPDVLTDEFFARIEATTNTPAEVTDLNEAAALMVHRIRTRYPEADIFLFNNPVMKTGNTYRNAYNQVLEALARRYGCTVVDLYGSDMSSHSVYTSDGIHPNSAGMDIITESFAQALYKKYAEDRRDPEIIPDGASANKTNSEISDLEDGGSGSEGTAAFVPQMFRWELNAAGNALESHVTDLLSENALMQTGTISGGAFHEVQFSLAEALNLQHDRPWSIEWCSSGNWGVGDMLFSTQNTNTIEGNWYIYRPSNKLSLGIRENNAFHNYGASLAGISTSQAHTYRLVNQIAGDGSNMVHLYVDDREIGPLISYDVNGGNSNTVDDRVNGLDFQFAYIGAKGHLVGGTGLQYLLVNEGLEHTLHTEEPIPEKPPTLEQTGLTGGKRCADCHQILEPQTVVPTLRDNALLEALSGKKLSVLGDGISTYEGFSNRTEANETLSGNEVWYDSSRLPSADDTWWKQAADQYGMEILVNNAWSGSSVSGTDEASCGWNTRPVNLHSNNGVSPDIIAIYMGTGDLTEGAACGTALDDSFFARIEAPGFVPSPASNFEEAAALMVYKVVSTYPNADVFLFNNPTMGNGDADLRTAYNNVFRRLASRYGCTVVDLFNSPMSTYGSYTLDGIHPNAAGMDVMTQLFVDTLYEQYVEPSAATKRGVYLSDLSYIPDGTKIGYGKYGQDSNSDGNPIQLRLDGVAVAFDKGIGTHATSTVTFDISRYVGDYPRFCAYLGVNATQGTKGNLSFRILGSNVFTPHSSSTGWDVLLTTDPLTAGSNAVAVDLDISGYKYIRLYADALGSNANDHSVYANARLVARDYDIDAEYFSRLHTLQWYNEQLSQHDHLYNLDHNMQWILERELVSRLGHANIQSQVKNSETMEDTLTWLLEDPHALQLFIETGNITNAPNTLKYLDILYQNYKGILGSSGDGYVYKKMLLALAITWANDRVLTPYSFGGGILGSTTWYFDILERFEAAKWVYDQGYQQYSKRMYTSYNMELMRALMCDYTGRDEVQWVQHYAAKKYPDNPAWWTGPYRFMGYVHPPLYARQEYFSAETWPDYDAKYDLTQYNISRTEWDNKVYRMWMVYEAGGICWNISRIGSTLNKSYGIPSVGTFQPGHEAYFTYSENEAGQGIWSIGNNVGGWACVYNNWGGTTTRMPLNWGSGTDYSQKTRNSSTYILLAQGALNQYDEWQTSLYLNLLADAYDSPEEKLSVYWSSLEALNLNLDTYLDIIGLYKEQGDAISPETWLALAMDIIEAYTYYPVAMVDLVNAIAPYCGNYGTNLISAKTKALEKARVATEAESLQYGACITLANSMLGREVNDVLATFSFDGEYAGAIVLGESYEQYAFELQYSLDGGETWYNYIKDVDSSRRIQLTSEQLNAINAGDDILMYISGMNIEGEDPDYFTIDIQEGTAPVVGRANAATQISIHDGENWILGKTRALEYSTDGGNTWAAYDHKVTRFPGNQTIQVRYAPHSTSLLGPATTLTFTDTNEREHFRHISAGSVTLVRDNGTTYYEGRKGDLALDANPFTGWHSENNQLEENKQIVVSFDKPRQFAGITYQSAGRNGRFTGVDIWVSMDDITWTLVGTASDWSQDDTMKTVVLENSVPARYVKLQATTVNGYVCANDIDFFEDFTTGVSAVSIHYSTTAPTNRNVTASLILAEGFTPVGKSSHIFADNGEHIFTYADAAGQEYQLAAKVDWIDKTAPTATVTYSTTAITDGPVTATITPDEAVTITNNGGSTEYTFLSNGSFTFRMEDPAGNAGTITAEVNWIVPDGSSVATFSFTGGNAGKLLLNAFYTPWDVEVRYRLGYRGEKTVTLAGGEEKVIGLTAEELQYLADLADNAGEIGVRVVVSGQEDNVQTGSIDLKAGPAAPAVRIGYPSSNIAVHDGENWITGKISDMEYSADGLHWKAYDSTVRFPGAQTIRVRYAADGLTRPSPSLSLTFTQGDSPSFTHIPASQVSLHALGGALLNNTRGGQNALDANPHTSWHSAANIGDENKWISVKFSEVKSFAGFTYQTEGSNGRFKQVTLYTSLDGEAWTEQGISNVWGNDTALKTMRLEEPVKAQYVKLHAVTYNSFISARDIDFYEDTTVPMPGNVSVEEYLRLHGQSLWLVRYSATPAESMAATYAGSPMFWSEKYDAYCCLVIAESLRQEDAITQIGTADGAAIIVPDTTDVNGTGVADASDAQLVYNMYNARYAGFTADVTMEKFLRADINGDCRVDTEDAAAIVAAILQRG